MFLSKLFSIFKKKDKSTESTIPTATPTTGTVGAAVGLSQPNQAITPNNDTVAQAEPNIPQPDVGGAADVPAPEPSLTTPPSVNPPTDDNVLEPQPPVEEPPELPETPPAPPQETPAPAEPPVTDDNQNIAV